MTNCAGRHLQLFLSWLPAPEMSQAEAQGSLHIRGVPQKSGTLSMECAIYIHKQRMGTELTHGWPTPPLMISETSSLPNWPEAGCWKGEPKVVTCPPRCQEVLTDVARPRSSTTPINIAWQAGTNYCRVSSQATSSRVPASCSYTIIMSESSTD